MESHQNIQRLNHIKIASSVDR